jgi:hypoxanthine phosphoribosyltransferase
MSAGKIVYTAEEISQRVGDLAAEIDSDLDGERPLLVSVLRGSVMFLADLVRKMPGDPDIDFMSISSYPGERERTGVVRIVKDLEEPLESRHVVVVEDIVDTGLSLSYLLRALANREPASLRVCTLIDKPTPRIADLELDYVGFETEQFLVGYGLDFQGRYRNLPHLVAVSDPTTLSERPDSLDEMVFSRGRNDGS